MTSTLAIAPSLAPLQTLLLQRLRTDGGGPERLLAGAEPIESAYASAEAVASSEGQTISGTVRIGTPDGFGSLFLAPRMQVLTDRHPKLEIEF
jgi:hypothetical protein